MKIDYNKIFTEAQDIAQNEKSTHDELGAAFDMGTAIWNVQPKHPHVVFMLATIAARRKQTSLAQLLYEVFVTLEPQPWRQAAGWMNMGILQHEQGERSNARELFNRTLEILQNCEESDAQETKRFALLNLASTYQAEGEPDKGIEILDRILRDYPGMEEIDRVKSNKGMLLLEKGVYGEGFSLNAELVSRRDKRTYQNAPLWDGSKGKTVIISGEQGIGDEIMFASMIPDAMKDCNVIMDAHLRLADLFRRSFNIPVYGTREFNAMFWFPPEGAYRLPIGDLGKFYRHKTEDFPGTPYLKADSVLMEKAKEKLGGLCQKPCIGISWKGGTKETNKQYRNVGLQRMLPLFQSIDANWISLQYKKDSAAELNEFYGKTGIKIEHWQDWVDDYDMTAALLTQLDLVISVPQSVVHLAGALGVKTWQLCPKKAMWQMGVYGQDMPWYKSVRNYWQDTAWEPVIENVKKDLCSLYPKSIAA